MWRARDDDREHAALADVECELRPAVRLCRRVELFDGSIFPDEPESRRILELHVGRHWQPRGGFGELAEAALPSGACVPQYTAFDGDLARRNVPRLRRRVDQHGARGRAGLAHLLVRVGDGRRAARSLYAEQKVLVQLRIRRRVLGADLRPVRIQLLGHQCGQPRERTLAKLDVLDEHSDGVVGTNTYECVRREWWRSRRRRGG